MGGDGVGGRGVSVSLRVNAGQRRRGGPAEERSGFSDLFLLFFLFLVLFFVSQRELFFFRIFFF